MIIQTCTKKLTAFARTQWAQWKPAKYALRVGSNNHLLSGLVEIKGPPEDRAQMFAFVTSYWRGLGEREPYWSVSSFRRFKRATFDQNADQFFKSGEHAIHRIESLFSRNQQSLSSVKIVAELGCGVGRETAFLAQRFDRIIALDVSAPHLRLARNRITPTGSINVEFVNISTVDDLKQLPRVDLFYSVFVLQHNPPPIIVQLLNLLFERLHVGGYALFQVPTFRRDYSFIWNDYVRKMSQGFPANPEMHIVPQHVVFALMRAHDLELLEVQEDTHAGSPVFISNTFFARKSQVSVPRTGN